LAWAVPNVPNVPVFLLLTKKKIMIQKIEFRKANSHEFYTYDYVVLPGEIYGKKVKVRLFGKDFWQLNPNTKKLEKYTIDSVTNTKMLLEEIKKGNIYLPKQ
jgi:hypothetical protein